MKNIISTLAILPLFISCASGYTKIKKAQGPEKNITVGYNIGNIVFMKSKLRAEAAQSGIAGIDKDAAKESAMNAKDGKDIYPGEVGRKGLGGAFKAIPTMVHAELQKAFPGKNYKLQPVGKVMSGGKIKMMQADFSKISTNVFYYVDVYCLVREENNSPATPVEFKADLNCETSLRVYQKQEGKYKSLLTRAIGRYQTKPETGEAAPVITGNNGKTNGYMAKTFGPESKWLNNLKEDTSVKLAKAIGKIQAAKVK